MRYKWALYWVTNKTGANWQVYRDQDRDQLIQDLKDVADFRQCPYWQLFQVDPGAGSVFPAPKPEEAGLQA